MRLICESRIEKRKVTVMEGVFNSRGAIQQMP